MTEPADQRMPGRTRIEWRTFALIAVFWLAFATLMTLGQQLPTIVGLAALALLGAFYGSLQHEVIHRHPTPWLALNRLFVIVPLQLFMPFERYRSTHLQHHNSDLTDPATDPESYYLSRSDWQASGPLRRMMFRGNRTLAGRLSYGPALSMIRYWVYDLRLCGRNRGLVGIWARHIVGCCLVVAVVVAAPLTLWTYVVGFVYGGLALTMLRSFAEHCADQGAERTAVVASGRFFSLLYLNNNLHIAHHDQPQLAWYLLPTLGSDATVVERAQQGAGYYGSYRDVFRRYGVRQFCQVVHPYEDPA